ncbi:hypothetical protein COV42_00635 [Candidatus Campbellbacteria bacterium CG11_big_fil_rev_8_21_14_0_20_44_21]|uniref:RNHCP domain-containing protein n=1 Tax=Candidatus Campbellbacteria bacterium CG22_combo_CG10-13_8_21_14_all_43_18 TaxID=1974530 RepID=A0A2H0DXS8_9BACT|nr:MAG: hypothetical protein COW82_00085 [Candidatus Campbellbacteria bacterium CG22_combo_CG10-13_8_21_14_all_43_18]PIR24412.1 MAG: hypothetical protein COV42_00635 [Candidatus Campbellbacteria bacterium CG11_big_fil_rev_8_21_14_0_20_44_21]
MRKFQRKIEDFKCDNCELYIKGNGYTNHCPECFYSKHVDVNPGDRASNCGGLMKAVDYGEERGGEYLVHQCLKCKRQKRNKISKRDDYNNLLNLVKKLNEERV